MIPRSSFARERGITEGSPSHQRVITGFSRNDERQDRTARSASEQVQTPQKRILDLGRFNFPWHDYMIGAIGNVVLFVVGYAASRIFEVVERPDSRKAAFSR